MSDRIRPSHADDDEAPMGAAGREAENHQPSEMGTAGIYATRVHEEGEEALEEGRR